MAATATKFYPHYQAMVADRELFRKKIDHHAVEPWEGNHIPLKNDLVQLIKTWPRFAKSAMMAATASTECPIFMEEQEVKETVEKFAEQEEMDESSQVLRDVIGCSSDGWVPCEEYEEAVAQVAAMKEQALALVADDEFELKMGEKHWAFDDFDEDE